MLPTLLTILTLAECPPDTAYHPYACGVPSRHAPNTAAHPYACGVPSRHAPDTSYHPYARGVHSRHAPNTDAHPYARRVHSRHCCPSLRSRSALPTCSKHHLFLRLCSALLTCYQNCCPSLHLRSALPTCSQNHLSLSFRTTSIVYGGLLAYTMNAIAKIF
ncbi:hypothetical protein O181_124034 [Austropuccinia psidii MF-1]|uniref:Uncharacterized protein n=1 Tax=Austropuccinia psidii MF-1 TaxID=1389203 RepID=A0A9Q3KR99_9BASI|nr:hypothetical protein [Austropuccinia psidii MF-1]